MARESFRQFGAALCEAISASRMEPEAIGARFEVEGEEHRAAAQVPGRGLFLMTAHFGPWEVAAYPIGNLFANLQLVARPPDNPYVAADLERMRARFGSRLITKAGAGHRMLNAVRRGGTVGLLIDQRVRPEVGVLVPFFGRPVWTTPVLAYLSLVTRAPVLPAFCYPVRRRSLPAALPAGDRTRRPGARRGGPDRAHRPLPRRRRGRDPPPPRAVAVDAPAVGAMKVIRPVASARPGRRP